LNADQDATLSDLISRRRFVAQSSGLFVGLATGDVFRPRREATVRVGVVDFSGVPRDARSMGLIIGFEEASHAASLFGGSFTLVPSHGDSDDSGLTALIGDTNCARLSEPAQRANQYKVPFFNVSCGDDALRGADCLPTMFHIAPSDAMLRDATKLAGGTGPALAWHESLVRFGADTLNRRFAARFNAPMSADAWTAWMATKIVWESALRAGSGQPSAVLGHLRSDAAQFDGHKGVPLSFRPWNRQLRQPVYVETSKGFVDVPVVAGDEPARVALDRIGAGAAASACRHPS
jgi:hypothetical protein